MEIMNRLLLRITENLLKYTNFFKTSDHLIISLNWSIEEFEMLVNSKKFRLYEILFQHY